MGPGAGFHGGRLIGSFTLLTANHMLARCAQGNDRELPAQVAQVAARLVEQPFVTRLAGALRGDQADRKGVRAEVEPGDMRRARRRLVGRVIGVECAERFEHCHAVRFIAEHAFELILRAAQVRALAALGAQRRVLLKTAQTRPAELHFAETELRRHLLIVPAGRQPDVLQRLPAGQSKALLNLVAHAITVQVDVVVSGVFVCDPHLQLAPQPVAQKDINEPCAAHHRSAVIVGTVGTGQRDEGHHWHDLVPLRVELAQGDRDLG